MDNIHSQKAHWKPDLRALGTSSTNEKTSFKMIIYFETTFLHAMQILTQLRKKKQKHTLNNTDDLVPGHY